VLPAGLPRSRRPMRWLDAARQVRSPMLRGRFRANADRGAIVVRVLRCSPPDSGGAVLPQRLNTTLDWDVFSMLNLPSGSVGST
jgi:hypothetical protein